MAAGLTVGDFSRATHLSVKTLRHYHQVGLLQPATVNPGTGYRYYSARQSLEVWNTITVDTTPRLIAAIRRS
jgi:DNA-binding transcriptional MerR regulator